MACIAMRLGGEHSSAVPGRETTLKFQMTRRRATVLLAFVALLLSIPVTATASYAASDGWLRLGNLSTTTSPVDVYVYSSGHSSPEFMVPDVAYGAVSGYRSVPVLTASVNVQASHSYTAAALSPKGQGAQLKILDDSLNAPSGKSLVRVIQASTKQSSVKFHCSCAPGAPGDIVTHASTGSVSGYAPIPAGTWTMSAIGSSAQASLPVKLVGNTVHTEVVLDGSSGLEIVNLTDAVGMGQPPTGGVATGFGGTAPHGPGSPLPWLALIGAGAVAAVTGGRWLRRKGPRAV
jgi:hypothetical protein